MKKFEAKTLTEVLDIVSKDLNIPIDKIFYIIKNKNDEHVEIETYSLEDVGEYGINFLKNAIKCLGFNVDVNYRIDSNNNIVNVNIIDSENNSILIGKNGKTLNAFNDILRIVISNHFKRKIRIFLDINHYKDRKYEKIINLTRKVAKEVIKKHIDVKLDAMTNDERKLVHQVLMEFGDVIGESESDDNNKKRAVVIKYIGKEEHAFQRNAIYYKNIINEDNYYNFDYMNTIIKNNDKAFLNNNKNEDQKHITEMNENNKNSNENIINNNDKKNIDNNDIPDASISIEDILKKNNSE